AAIAVQATIVASLAPRRARQLAKIVPLINRHAVGLDQLDDDALRARAQQVRQAFRQYPELRADDIARCFGIIREASARVLGQRHFDVQLIGGYTLVRGMIAEMNTGEGKTLTASLAAITAALAGMPVHVVTVNDYLAARDLEKLDRLYKFF